MSLNLETFKDVAREQLAVLLGRHFNGKKDLIIDPPLMSLLDRLTGVKFLRDNDVGSIFLLDQKENLGGCNKRIFLVRPDVQVMKSISASINADQRANKLRKYRILMVPRRLYVCDHVLEQEGVYGKVEIEELKLSFLPLDDDILTLENHYIINSFFLEGDFTWLHTVASSVNKLQTLFGAIPLVCGQGKAAKIVHKLSKTLLDEDKTNRLPNYSKIDQLILIDRSVDFVTPLCSQVTYEGLLDDIFGINCGQIEFGEDVTKTKKSVKAILNSEDVIFEQIRNKHFASVGNILKNRANKIQKKFDEKDQMSISELKSFVSNELAALQKQYRSVSLHLGASEVIMKHKSGSLKQGDLQDILHVEHSLLAGISFNESLAYIEECIHRQYNITLTLKLLCLLSCTNSGLLPKDYQNLKQQFLSSYGFEHMITFFNLKKVGLLVEAQTNKNQSSMSIESGLNKFADKMSASSTIVASSLVALQKKDWFHTISKKLSLIPREIVDPQKEADMSYVFSSAYVPLTCRLAEQAIERNGWGTLDDIMRHLPGDTFEKHETKSAKSGTMNTSRNVKTVVVYFIGGVTYTEIAALRLLSKQKGCKIIIATTSIINGERLLKPFLN